MVLVDVRAPAETAVSMIPGAVTKAAFEQAAAHYAHHTVVAYCTIGYRSGKYCQELGAAHRAEPVLNLNGRYATRCSVRATQVQSTGSSGTHPRERRGGARYQDLVTPLYSVGNAPIPATSLYSLNQPTHAAAGLPHQLIHSPMFF